MIEPPAQDDDAGTKGFSYCEAPDFVLYQYG